MMTIKTYDNIIFDLDDTLCDCNIYYIDARERLVRFLNKETGIPLMSIRNIFKSIDGEAKKATDGYVKERLPKIYKATAIACSVISGKEWTSDLAFTATTLAEEVFSAPYKLYDFATNILDKCKESQKRILLYTLGDPTVQFRKVRENSLLQWFDKNDIVVTSAKTIQNLTNFVQERNIDINRTLLIGDSLRHDIIPASILGLDTVWIRHRFLDLTEDVAATYTIDHIAELNSILWS